MMKPKSANDLAVRLVSRMLVAAVLMGLLTGCVPGGDLEEGRADFFKRVGTEEDDASPEVVPVDASDVVVEAPTAPPTVTPTDPPTPTPTVTPMPTPTAAPTPAVTPAPMEPEAALPVDLSGTDAAPLAEPTDGALSEDVVEIDSLFESIPGVTLLPVAEVDVTPPASSARAAETLGVPHLLGTHRTNLPEEMADVEILPSAFGDYFETSWDYATRASDTGNLAATARNYFNQRGWCARFVAIIPLETAGVPVSPTLITRWDSEFTALFGGEPTLAFDMWGNGFQDASRSHASAALVSGGHLLRYWYDADSTWIVSIYRAADGRLLAALVGEPLAGSIATPAPSEINLLQVRDLSDAYARNELNAERTYQSSFMLLQGTIQSIRRNPDGSASVTLATEGGGQMDPDSRYLFVCHFGASRENELMPLEAGQLIVISGQFVGLTGERQNDQAVVELVRCSVPGQEP